VLDPLLDAGKQFGSTHVVHVGGPERLELPKCRSAATINLASVVLNSTAMRSDVASVMSSKIYPEEWQRVSARTQGSVARGLPGMRLGVDEARSERLHARFRHKRVHGVPTAVVRFDGAVYFVPRYAVHRPVAGRILRKKYAQPRLHESVGWILSLRPGNAIHAGTFFGDMLPSFSRKTSGLVYAFEPVLENYLLARHVVERNDLDNVMLFHAGLAEQLRPGLVETSDDVRHRGGGSFVVTDPEVPTFATQRVPLISLDQLALSDVSLLQLDVEGFERQVLEGARDTVARNQPVIVLEDARDECRDFLADLGYSPDGQAGRDRVYLTDSLRGALPGEPPWRRERR
jgi:FkbM family methyltransferase